MLKIRSTEREKLDPCLAQIESGLSLVDQHINLVKKSQDRMEARLKKLTTTCSEIVRQLEAWDKASRENHERLMVRLYRIELALQRLQKLSK
ncbi:uncharacterized protein EI97DRAFT_462844 [Westerdykella ornata]|uniref:Uncharacterized protein n=1 Tax=Westerdykella ornata TaxID=318751 RepID=A0A6A6J4D2_WESOR|nr:uncharacterized protein EI97DRAFT_462844 [Westerdykella ornata]KAF2271430.1 hypothetical protein EI97DRAFT_462844 [Westerdykella ornata]